MSLSIKNLLGVICGLLVGSITNMGIVVLGSFLFPPEIKGLDTSTVEGLNEYMMHVRPVDLFIPLLAHALGTFAGVIIAGMIAPSTMRVAMLIALFFMAGGVYMVIKVQAPLWFEISDLTIAYIPVAWVAEKIIRKKTESPQ